MLYKFNKIRKYTYADNGHFDEHFLFPVDFSIGIRYNDNC